MAPPTDLILILGARNDVTGLLDATAIARADTALHLFRGKPGSAFILAGGRAAHFNVSPRSHAGWLADYLLSQGVSGEAIQGGVLSGNTVEDAVFARDLLDLYPAARVTIVTSHFHLPRAALVFRCVFAQREMMFVAADDALSVAGLEKHRAHEQRAVAQLIAQRGVVWQGRLFPLPPGP